MTARALAILVAVSLPAAASAQQAGNGMIIEPTVVSLGETGPGAEVTAPVTVTNTEPEAMITLTFLLRAAIQRERER